MRKQTKLVAVLSAAALLAIGASMTSFAAKGWVEEGGQWYYYNNNGDAVEDEWKKSGNNWFWLGDDGAMVTDALIEDGNSKYYVNANGAMVTNSWVAVEPGEDDYEDDAPDHYWYYFGANGRAYKATNGMVKKTLNGKTYAFDEEGKMLYGFVDDQGSKLTDEEPFKEAVYYFGDSDDGAMQKGWLEYTDGSDESDYEDLDVMWFYFDSNGKKVDSTSTSGQYKEKSINGQKYAFDEYGVMTSEFTDTSLASGATATRSNGFKYFSDQYDGHLKKNSWFYAIPDEDYSTTYGISDYDDGTYRWFYANASGSLTRSQKKKINGKYYVFDAAGRMKTELVLIGSDGKTFEGTLDTDVVEGADFENGRLGLGTAQVYYFGNDDEKDGSMKTGKNIKIDLADDTYTFGFEKSGKAMNGIKDDKIYRDGLLLTASSDYKYVRVTEDGTDYVIGTNGSIVKPHRAVKDSDGKYYAVNTKGDIKEISEDEDYASKKASCYAKNGKLGEAVTNSDGETTGWKCN